MEQKKFALLVKLVSIASACVIFVLTLIAIVQFFEIGSANRRKASLQIQISYASEEKYSLEQAISKQKDAKNAEKYAREQLGYIEDGDIVYE